MKFTSLEDLKNFVITQKISEYEKQKEIEKKFIATLKKGKN
jgi:hypothetical protein